MLNPRELRHRINIERRINKLDPETGDVTPRWSVLHENVPAKIAPISAREFLASQAVQSGVIAKITIRHRDGLSADMRIIHNGKIYNPQGWFADLDSGLSYLTAPCTEGLNEG